MVGVVRLTCAPDALVVALLRAGGAGAGFVPAGLGEGREMRVPYSAVRSVFRRNGALHVVLDPRLSHTRLALARLATEPEGLGGVRWFRGLDERALARSLEAALVARLGLMPVEFLDEGPSDPVGAERLASPRAGRLALVLGAAAALTLGSLVALRALRGPVAVAPRYVEAQSGIAAVAAALPTAGLIVHPPPPPPCVCERAASPLWEHGLPAVSFLVQPGDDRVPEALSAESHVGGFAVSSAVDEEGGPPRFDFEVAAVNNAARPLSDLRAVLTFARRDGQGKRVAAHDEGLFWEGALAPGRAVKWSAEGEGTEVRIDVDRRGFLPGAPAEVLRGAKVLAPADAARFRELSHARLSVVRYHGATVLAYLRDAKASELAAALEARGEVERQWRERIQRASAPVFTCDLEVRAGKLGACVHNASEGPVELDGLREPEGTTRSFALTRVRIDASRGVRVEAPFDGGPPPRELAPALAP